MRIVYISILILLFSCKQQSLYKQVVLSEETFAMDVLVDMNVEGGGFLDGDLVASRIYYLPDTTCFIIVGVYKASGKEIRELIAREKRILPDIDLGTRLVSTEFSVDGNIQRASIRYKSDESGDYLNDISILADSKFIIKISVRFKATYKGGIGNNRDIIKHVSRSFKRVSI